MPKKSKLKVYLDEQKIDGKVELDILQFWKCNQYRLPRVVAMARDVLCIHISIVASESSFSNNGRVLYQYQSALKHDIVKCCGCCYGNVASIISSCFIRFISYPVIHSTRHVAWVTKLEECKATK
ncbi:hypothetical protein M5K25_024312 [Dendrobium thyrsiflorum]|uniref:HAT C-terminal dimerisation domain-containing protein n=1 Tax=Dendrobium thyrsiflorum TaxID=117978 RepID=A0ABD0U1U0_DENTH